MQSGNYIDTDRLEVRRNASISLKPLPRKARVISAPILRPHPTGMRAATSATGPSKRCSTGSSRSTARHSWTRWRARACAAGCSAKRALPDCVRREFNEFLRCGRLEHGFLRVRCESCHAERLVAFSYKRRGFCPSCGARRMAEAEALLVDEVFPDQPVRPRFALACCYAAVLSFPCPLRFLLLLRFRLRLMTFASLRFASRPGVMGKVLGIVYRVIATHLVRSASFTQDNARTGAVTLIQRFGSALNLNVHFHMLFLDGVHVERPDGRLRFRWVKAPTSAELTAAQQSAASHCMPVWRLGPLLSRMRSEATA